MLVNKMLHRQNGMAQPYWFLALKIENLIITRDSFMF
jgi:hypothetical protein